MVPFFFFFWFCFFLENIFGTKVQTILGTIICIWLSRIKFCENYSGLRKTTQGNQKIKRVKHNWGQTHFICVPNESMKRQGNWHRAMGRSTNALWRDQYGFEKISANFSKTCKLETLKKFFSIFVCFFFVNKRKQQLLFVIFIFVVTLA